MSVVNYRLRDELQTLIVCLYNPHDAPETTFTTETISNYIRDCEWELMTGETVKRIPFHITASPADAERACDTMRQSLQDLRKRKSDTECNSGYSSSPGITEEEGGEEKVSHGVNDGGGENQRLPQPVDSKIKKRNTPYHLWKSTGKFFKPD